MYTAAPVRHFGRMGAHGNPLDVVQISSPSLRQEAPPRWILQPLIPDRLTPAQQRFLYNPFNAAARTLIDLGTTGTASGLHHCPRQPLITSKYDDLGRLIGYWVPNTKLFAPIRNAVLVGRAWPQRATLQPGTADRHRQTHVRCFAAAPAAVLHLRNLCNPPVDPNRYIRLDHDPLTGRIDAMVIVTA